MVQSLLQTGIDAYLNESESELFETLEPFDHVSLTIKETPWGAYQWVTSNVAMIDDNFKLECLTGHVTDNFVLNVEYFDSQITTSQFVTVKGRTNLEKRDFKLIPKNKGFSTRKRVFGDIQIDQKESSTYFEYLSDLIASQSEFIDNHISTRTEKTESFPFKVVDLDLDTIRNFTFLPMTVYFTEKEIFIDSTCQINNSWIIGESIHIANGFEGVAQLTCSSQVKLGERTRLKFPSSISIIEKDGVAPIVELFGQSHFSGSIIGGQGDQAKLLTNPSSRVEGQIIWNGDACLSGNIDGQVSCKRLISNSDSYFSFDVLDEVVLSYITLNPYFLGAISEKEKRVLHWIN